MRPKLALCISLSAVVVFIAASTSLPQARAAVAPENAPLLDATTLGHLPELHVPGVGQAPLRAESALRPLGIEGFGDSVIEMSNVGDSPSDVVVNLRQWGSPEESVRVHMEPGRSWRFRLADQLSLGRWTGSVVGNSPLAIVGRTEWANGAAVAYEPPPVAEDVILPLMMRSVDGHDTVFNILNLAGGANTVDLRVFDPNTGDLLLNSQAMLDAPAVFGFDTTQIPKFQELPVNAAGGFLGALRLSAGQPIAVMAYGDVSAGDGASAYVGMPTESGSTLQVLPLVRSNYLGDSIIAVASTSATSSTRVELDYQGSTTANGRDQISLRQSFELAPNGAAFIDLSGRGRGNQPAPAPLGTETNPGFVGNVKIRASGPVVALAHEEVLDRRRVYTVAAYNGFGHADFGTRFSAPSLRGAGERGTQFAVVNPTTRTAEIVGTYHGLTGEEIGRFSASVMPGVTWIESVPANIPPGSRLDLSSNRPVAAVVYDTSMLSPEDWGKYELDTTVYRAVRVIPAELPKPGVATPTPRTGPNFQAHLPLVLLDVERGELPDPRTAEPSPTPTATSTATPTPTPGPPTPTPTATKLPSRIVGRITVLGEPAPVGLGETAIGPQIELRRRSGVRWEKVDYAVVGEDGRFSFENPASLTDGDAYQVWWDVDPSLYLTDYLLRWTGAEIETFGPGDEVDVGTFEVGGDLTLSSPGSGSHWTLPKTFRWSMRSHRGDSYRWALSPRCNADNRRNAYLAPSVGRGNRYELEWPPPGTTFDVEYCWWVLIEDDSGGRGWAHDFWRIEFDP